VYRRGMVRAKETWHQGALPQCAEPSPVPVAPMQLDCHPSIGREADVTIGLLDEQDTRENLGSVPPNSGLALPGQRGERKE